MRRADRLFEIMGLSREEVTPSFELFMELVHPEDRARVAERLPASPADMQPATDPVSFSQAPTVAEPIFSVDFPYRADQPLDAAWAGFFHALTYRCHPESGIFWAQEVPIAEPMDRCSIVECHSPVPFRRQTMARYYVNKNRQPSGEHEVHNWDVNCDHPPELRNRVGFLTYNDDVTYLGRLWAVFPLRSWLNYNARRQYRYLPPPEVAKAIIRRLRQAYGGRL
jgi:hypothetical protein